MNPTQKALFLLLLVTGIGLWAYNGALLMGVVTPSPPADATPDTARLNRTQSAAAPDTARSGYSGNFRDPFEPVWGDEEEALPVEPAPRPTPQPAPRLAVVGIMWNPKKPMASIQGPGGEIENLWVGMTIAGATVTKIEREAVTLKFNDQTIRLEAGAPKI